MAGGLTAVGLSRVWFVFVADQQCSLHQLSFYDHFSSKSIQTRVPSNKPVKRFMISLTSKMEKNLFSFPPL